LLDGRLVLFDQDNPDEAPFGSLILADSRTRRTTKLIGGEGADEVWTQGFSISRDERWIYFTLASRDGDLWLAELR
jgi:hypothetical protein